MTERRGRRRRGRAGRPVARALIGPALISALSACTSGTSSTDDRRPAAADYPSLRSVPASPRLSSPVEERRQIVRELIDKRDRSQRQTAIVRKRSGLSVDPSIMVGGEIRPEDVVPDTSERSGDPFRLRTGSQDNADSVYRGDTRFEDGGLDDFIRQLKRDTLPAKPAGILLPNDELLIEKPEEEDVGFLVPKADPGDGDARPVLLAAIGPVIGESRSSHRDVMIRLAAAEEEPGVFCSWAGWAVAWSGACVDETAPEPGGDQGVGADLDAEDGQSGDSPNAERPAEPEPSTETGRARAERRLSEEDAAEAIENAGRSALAPVSSSLEKLRDFIRRRGSGDEVTSPADPRLSLSRDGPMPPVDAVVPPPIPRDRPERREDIVVVERGERFEFNRTPTPAFKPSRQEPTILPPAKVPSDPPPRPRTRPLDLVPEPATAVGPVSSGDGEGARAEALQPGEPEAREGTPGGTALALTSEPAPDPAPQPAPEVVDAPAPARETTTASLEEQSPAASALEAAKTPTVATPEREPAGPEDSASLDPLLILFEPETASMPDGMMPRLEALLDDARARDRKIHIIGEAGTNHLARRRATDVGAALVQLGATVEILEYDHALVPGVDQVRLVPKSSEPDPLFSTSTPTIIEK